MPLVPLANHLHFVEGKMTLGETMLIGLDSTTRADLEMEFIRNFTQSSVKTWPPTATLARRTAHLTPATCTLPILLTTCVEPAAPFHSDHPLPSWLPPFQLATSLLATDYPPQDCLGFEVVQRRLTFPSESSPLHRPVQPLGTGACDHSCQ